MSGFVSFKKIQLKVLIVEDDHITRTSLAQLLDSHFQETYYADDGQTGLEKYAQHKPDVIFTDIMMPNMNGVEMLHRIKEQSGRMPTCIIFSALDETDDENSLAGLKIYHTMKKPFNFNELESLVAEISKYHNLSQ